MKKLLLILIVLFSGASLSVSADDSPPPSDCINPYEYLDGKFKDFAPTCKEIQNTSTIVSLDPALQKDYFLGTHSPIFIGYSNGIIHTSKYSESITISTSAKIVFPRDDDSEEIVVSPQLKTVLLDRNFFESKINDILNNNGLNTTKNNAIYHAHPINIINSDEFLKFLEGSNEKTTLERYLSAQSLSSKVGDSIIKNFDGSYTVSVFDYNDYGKHIYAPKGDIIEAQYIDVDKGQFLEDKDLQIDYLGGKHCGSACTTVVPLTSPLRSVVNYWVYTKQNGRLVLLWQKSEYELDNGQKKVITNTDKNVTAALLFDNSSGGASVTTTPFDTVSVSLQATNTSAVGTTEKKVGFIARFFNFVLSWFK